MAQGNWQSPVSGAWTAAQIAASPVGILAVDAADNIIDLNGNVVALVEVTPYVALAATGTAFTGACEYAGYQATVAAGNITIYDNTSAAGTVILATTALSGTTAQMLTHKIALTTGCHVVLSDASARVNIFVG